VRLIRDLSQLGVELHGGAVSIGNFDGVHRGHARIVAALRARAAAAGGPAVAFTFEPHPVRLLRPDQAPPPLTWTERKAELLGELGVDVLVAYPTDERLLSLSPEAFFGEIVVRQIGARAIVEGPNFYFGKDRAGDIQMLRELAEQAGMALEVVPPLVEGDSFISSSRIRALIREGDVAAACLLLTAPYRLRGMVTHGSSRGARIGFPTANLDAVDTILPAVGVYAGRAWTGGTAWPAAINIGPNPTFGEQALKIETHLIGFSGSLYGQPLEVDFLTRLRDTRAFASTADLQRQLQLDIQAATQLHQTTTHPGPP